MPANPSRNDSGEPLTGAVVPEGLYQRLIRLYEGKLLIPVWGTAAPPPAPEPAGSASADAATSPVHRAFWGMNWRVIVTTDWRPLPGKDDTETVTLGYDAGGLADQIDAALYRATGAAVVVALHGQEGDDKAPPLATREQVAAAYALDRPWPGSDLARLLDDLLFHYSLLLIGCAADEPFWQLVCRRLAQSDRRPEQPHFLLTVGPWPGPLPAGVEEVRLAAWADAAALLKKLALDWGSAAVAGRNRELANRENSYLECRTAYPEFEGPEPPVWVYHDADNLVPFVELWANRDDRPAAEVIRFRAPPRPRYALPEPLRPIRELYWRYIEDDRAAKNQKKPDNEVKIRVNDWSVGGGRLCLEVEPVEYKDYMVTNHFVANMGSAELDQLRQNAPELAALAEAAFQAPDPALGLRYDPRGRLCRTARDIRLTPEAPCSNHLGLSALVVADYHTEDGATVPVLLCPRSGDQVSSPKDSVPTVSGSCDWPMLPDFRRLDEIRPLEEVHRDPGRFLSLGHELYREAAEECLRGKKAFPLGPGRDAEMARTFADLRGLLRREALVNFCQNVERGGKPEFFFVLSLAITANEFLARWFRPSWELGKNYWHHSRAEIFDFQPRPAIEKMEYLPSPLDTDLRLAPDWREASRFLARVLRYPKYNPVLRANVQAVLRYCALRHPDEVRGPFSDLGLRPA